MAGIVGAHHTSFTVADLDRSVEFFRDRLGLELVYVREVRQDYFAEIVGHPGCVVRAAMLKIPGSGHHVELFQYLTPVGESHLPRPCDPGSCHLALLVDDLPALYAVLAGEGIEFVSAPVAITVGPNAGGYGLYLRDPNGILIELFQPPRTP
jgi:catechol 2,3-dioxygenase-like lactoylglutathione lyase family enzyme